MCSPLYFFESELRRPPHSRFGGDGIDSPSAMLYLDLYVTLRERSRRLTYYWACSSLVRQRVLATGFGAHNPFPIIVCPGHVRYRCHHDTPLHSSNID